MNELTEFLAQHQATTRDLQKRTAVALEQIGAHARRTGETLDLFTALAKQMTERLKEPVPVVQLPPPPTRRLAWLLTGIALGIGGAIALRTFGL